MTVHEFLRMTPPSFTGSSTTEDLEYFLEELRKMFELMHMVGVDRVEFVVYQLKSVARNLFNQWKEGRAEDAQHLSCACFEETLLGRFFT